MKRYFLFLLAVVISAAAMAQAEPAYDATFKYDKRIHDFGTFLEKDGKVSHTFTFTNTGKTPVVISDVNSWCGCTTAQFIKEPIMPGKKGTVTVTYDPNSRPGKFSKEVVLNLNDGKAYTRIWVKGNVVGYRHPVAEDYPYDFGYGLHMGYKVFAIPSLQQGQTYTIEQRLSNETDKEMTIDFVKTPNNTVLKMPASLTLKAKERTTFKVTYTAPVAHKYDRHIDIQVRVNGHVVSPIRVKWNGLQQSFTK